MPTQVNLKLDSIDLKFLIAAVIISGELSRAPVMNSQENEQLIDDSLSMADEIMSRGLS